MGSLIFRLNALTSNRQVGSGLGSLTRAIPIGFSNSCFAAAEKCDPEKREAMSLRSGHESLPAPNQGMSVFPCFLGLIRAHLELAVCNLSLLDPGFSRKSSMSQWR